MPQLVGAEAGGGKSRLAAEFTAQVRGRALVLAGACVDLGAAGLPYAPFTAALRELVRERGAAEVTGLLPGHDAGELAGLLPELGSPPAGGDPEMARGRLFGLLLALLERLAEKQPLRSAGQAALAGGGDGGGPVVGRRAWCGCAAGGF